MRHTLTISVRVIQIANEKVPFEHSITARSEAKQAGACGKKVKRRRLFGERKLNQM
jgi:hypothetical protein